MNTISFERNEQNLLHVARYPLQCELKSSAQNVQWAFKVGHVLCTDIGLCFSVSHFEGGTQCSIR
jgi:hypothetical protein